jgi:hypothetical protein
VVRVRWREEEERLESSSNAGTATRDGEEN